MSEDSSTTRAGVSKKVEKLWGRIYIWLVLCGLIILALLFLWISPWNPEKTSYWGFLQQLALRDFLLGLIIGLIPVCVIVMLSHIASRPFQVIKDQLESDEFADKMANKTQAAVEIPLTHMQHTIEELRATLPDELTRVLKYAELGHTAHALGIADISCNWKDISEFRGTLGTHFRDLLGKVKDATWYIVTMNPGGFLYWIGDIQKAVEGRGVNVKWAYFGCESLEDDDACRLLGVQLKEWLSRDPTSALKSLQTNTDMLLREVEVSSNRIHKMNGEQRKHAGHWELYESKVQHFYMTFLSVPKKYDRTLDQVPDGTFGFVYLYPMFARSDKHETRPALYLEASGQIQPSILDCYYWSIVRLFDEGVKQKHLLPTWPLGA